MAISLYYVSYYIVIFSVGQYDPTIKARIYCIIISIGFEMVIILTNNILYGFAQGKTEKKEEKFYLLLEWGSRGSSKGEFEILHSIAIDSFGSLFVTDTTNDRIQKFAINTSTIKFAIRSSTVNY